MRKLLAGLCVATLAGAALLSRADERIPNAHGNCAMPMSGFFRMADMDKTGAISRAEWIKMFNLIDQNHDGVIDAGEWAAFERNGMMMEHQMLLRGNPGGPATPASRP